MAASSNAPNCENSLTVPSRRNFQLCDGCMYGYSKSILPDWSFMARPDGSSDSGNSDEFVIVNTVPVLEPCDEPDPIEEPVDEYFPRDRGPLPASNYFVGGPGFDPCDASCLSSHVEWITKRHNKNMHHTVFKIWTRAEMNKYAAEEDSRASTKSRR